MQNTVWGKNLNTQSKKEEKKDEYKPDIRLQRLWKGLEEIKRNHRHEQFQNWLEENHDYGENTVSTNDILNQFCRDVFNVITKNGFTISNEKQLRNEIATFVYKTSDA